MNLPRIYERVYCQPVALAWERFMAIHSVVFPRLVSGEGFALEMIAAAGESEPDRPTVNLVGKRAQKARPRYRADGTVDSRLFYTAKKGVAVVPVYGVLAKNLSAFEEGCGGGTDTAPISRALAQAMADKTIRAVILDIDSPGGQVAGTPELAAEVAAAGKKKPVYAFSDASVFSAAYWIASQATEVYGTPSSRWGSIGVRAAWLDETVALQLKGLKLHTFASGKHKAMGAPGRGMTEAEMAMLQSMVDTMGAEFRATVKAARPKARAAAMEGQTHSVRESIAAGLVDGVVANWDAFVALV